MPQPVLVPAATIGPCLVDYLSYVAFRYDRQRFPGFQAAYQFHLTHAGQTHDCYVRVQNGQVDYGLGCIEKPNLVVHAPLELWMQISAKTRSGTLCYLLRRYTKQGPLRLLTMFDKVFGRPLTEHDIPALNDAPGRWETTRKRVWTKPQNVLVINASPRREHGFTQRYIAPFVDGMRAAGVSPDVLTLNDPALKIEPCRGCEACWKLGRSTCVIADDGNAVVDRIIRADLVVFAFPLYIDSVPAKLKALLDRCFLEVLPVFVESGDGVTRHPLRDKRKRSMAVLSVCGFPEARHFEPVLAMFRDIARNFHTPLVASLVRPGSQFLNLSPLMLVEREKVLRALGDAGRELVETGRVCRKNQAIISRTGTLPPAAWRLYSNLYWHLKGTKK